VAVLCLHTHPLLRTAWQIGGTSLQAAPGLALQPILLSMPLSTPLRARCQFLLSADLTCPRWGEGLGSWAEGHSDSDRWPTTRRECF
jgi:hypothetical protein